MQTTGADQALLVSFSGINKEAASLIANQQFKFKVWDADRVLAEVLGSYSRLSESIRKSLAFKQVWTLTNFDKM